MLINQIPKDTENILTTNTSLLRQANINGTNGHEIKDTIIQKTFFFIPKLCTE